MGRDTTPKASAARSENSQKEEEEKTPIPSFMTTSTKILAYFLLLLAFRGVSWVLPVLDGFVRMILGSAF